MRRLKIGLDDELRALLEEASARTGRSLAEEVRAAIRGERFVSVLSDYEQALLEITEAKGAFKCDPFEHAKSVIHDMHAIAVKVLQKHNVTPRRIDLE